MISTSVVTVPGADQNIQFGNACRLTRALKTRAAVQVTVKTLIGLVLVITKN